MAAPNPYWFFYPIEAHFLMRIVLMVGWPNLAISGNQEVWGKRQQRKDRVDEGKGKAITGFHALMRERERAKHLKRGSGKWTAVLETGMEANVRSCWVRTHNGKDISNKKLTRELYQISFQFLRRIFGSVGLAQLGVQTCKFELFFAIWSKDDAAEVIRIKLVLRNFDMFPIWVG